ncbi:uncharacterized protein LOC106804281 [Setaria italica]|uniref:uncharacterized protein LOC106804281 n=1 Tax=Setaria italica TaxID=4555 RepID=UPI0007199DA7|nr:uncharacterized protein LOC106804281 [Setaria italica]
MNVWFITKERSEGLHTSTEDSVYMSADNLFKRVMISVLAENLVNSYMQHPSSKALCDALEANFEVSDAGSELYIMEQFYDYKMIDDRPVVEQAHGIHAIAKDLDNLRCPLPDKFVVGGIIAKLPPLWRNFATTLKHKRQEFTIAGLIGTLDVEEKARAKDPHARGNEGGSSAHVHKGKAKVVFQHKTAQTTNFMKKKNTKGKCFVCGGSNYWTKDHKDKQQHRQKKSANVVIGDAEKGISGSKGLDPC